MCVHDYVNEQLIFHGTAAVNVRDIVKSEKQI